MCVQSGLTPLHVAAHYDNQKVALLLLNQGASPHVAAKVKGCGSSKTSPIKVEVISVSSLSAVTVLFPSVQNGYTPLHIAAKKNQMEITTTLLEYGAPTNTVTRQGITPLHLAAQEGNIDVVTLLLARDAPVNVGNKVRELWVNEMGGI